MMKVTIRKPIYIGTNHEKLTHIERVINNDFVPRIGDTIIDFEEFTIGLSGNVTSVILDIHNNRVLVILEFEEVEERFYDKIEDDCRTFGWDFVKQGW